MRTSWSRSAILFLALSVSAHAADNLNFRTFVSSSSIASVEGGNHATIAFNFAGNKFVGSVYVFTDNNQLYSPTSLAARSHSSADQFPAPLVRSSWAQHWA